jgi:TMEM175 potassium channel family protein
VSKSRLEAFSDGVIAILITIMVLGFQVPRDATWAALRAELPLFLTYVLSFVFLGIYWTNHHHLFQAVKHVDGRVLWANLHLLFWMSLVPFITGWVAATHLAPAPTALYGLVFLGAAVAYTILTSALLALHGNDSTLAKALGSDLKGKFSLAIYAVGAPVALVQPKVAAGLYIVVALIWFVPDRRIEKVLAG